MSEPSTLLFSCLGFLLFLVGPNALLVSMIVAAVFQATAFVNVGSSPLIVYYFLCVLFVLRSLLDILWKPQVIDLTLGRSSPIGWFATFILLAVAGAIWLPQAFDGLMVYSPKLSIDEQYNNLTQLTLGASHFNQAAQLLLNAFVFLILWFRGVPPKIILNAVSFAFATSVLFAVWQLISNLTGLYYPEEWLYTVDGWSIGNQQVVGSFLRINGTFLEPSAFSTYLVGIFAYFLVLWVKRPSLAASAYAVLALFAMIVTTSTTAYIGMILIVSAVFVGFGLTQVISGGWIDKSLFGIIVVVAALAWLASVLTIGLSEVRDLLDMVVAQKSDGDSFRFRLEADLQSFDVLSRTYGLGAGLGSNRPSSFLAFLVSNHGALGLLTFIMFTVSLTNATLGNANGFAEGKFEFQALASVWGLWATLIAKVFAQPDITFAPLWIWLFLLASFCTLSKHRSLETT